MKADYARKLQAAVEPATKGSAATFSKNLAKDALYAATKALANQIENTMLVTDAQRHELGLTIRTLEPTPIGPPATAPVVEIETVVGRTIIGRLHGGDSTKRRKLNGIAGARICSFVGDQPPADIRAWSFELGTTRTDFEVALPSTLPPGTKVWITACWRSLTEQTSPACAPVATHLNFGGPAMAA